MNMNVTKLKKNVLNIKNLYSMMMWKQNMAGFAWGCEMCIIPITLFWYHCGCAWMLSVVCVACVCHTNHWASTRPCGWFYIGGAYSYVGGVRDCIFPKICLGGSPLQEERVSYWFGAKVHSSYAFIKDLQYISPLELFVSGVLAWLHAGMVGKECFSYLVLWNKFWFIRVA